MPRRLTNAEYEKRDMLLSKCKADERPTRDRRILKQGKGICVKKRPETPWIRLLKNEGYLQKGESFKPIPKRGSPEYNALQAKMGKPPVIVIQEKPVVKKVHFANPIIDREATPIIEENIVPSGRFKGMTKDEFYERKTTTTKETQEINCNDYNDDEQECDITHGDKCDYDVNLRKCVRKGEVKDIEEEEDEEEDCSFFDKDPKLCTSPCYYNYQKKKCLSETAAPQKSMIDTIWEYLQAPVAPEDPGDVPKDCGEIFMTGDINVDEKNCFKNKKCYYNRLASKCERSDEFIRDAIEEEEYVPLPPVFTSSSSHKQVPIGVEYQACGDIPDQQTCDTYKNLQCIYNRQSEKCEALDDFVENTQLPTIDEEEDDWISDEDEELPNIPLPPSSTTLPAKLTEEEAETWNAASLAGDVLGLMGNIALNIAGAGWNYMTASEPVERYGVVEDLTESTEGELTESIEGKTTKRGRAQREAENLCKGQSKEWCVDPCKYDESTGCYNPNA